MTVHEWIDAGFFWVFCAAIGFVCGVIFWMAIA